SYKGEGVKGCRRVWRIIFPFESPTRKGCVEQSPCAWQGMGMSVFMEKSGVWEGTAIHGGRFAVTVRRGVPSYQPFARMSNSSALPCAIPGMNNIDSQANVMRARP
ncbi:MAG: hypothetical protein AMJ75_07880, partial [Phycisphaerae bacterium SM1_79]